MTQAKRNQPNGNQSTVNRSGLLRQGASAQDSQALVRSPGSAIQNHYFEQPVVLKQSPMWSRAIVWTIMGVATFGIGWASIAKIEQVVPATGQLKPTGAVQEIQAPVNGKVTEVYVEDGDVVAAGEVLMVFDSTATKAELDSQKKIRDSLTKENKFYRTLMGQSPSKAAIEAAILQLDLPNEVAFIARERSTLLEENQLYRIQIGGAASSADFGIDELERLRAAREEARSREQAAQLEVEQLRKQLDENRVQLAHAQTQLQTEQDILNDIMPLVQEGGIARLQGTRQQQQVQERQAEVARLQEEQLRLQRAIDQGRERLVNTKAAADKDVLDRIAANKNRIAEIDSQLTRVVVENEKRIAQLDAQISQSEVTLDYQEIKAPVDGVVFDLQAGPGYVPSPSKTEPLLKIVPNDNLVAEVYITNRDIGFVEKGMITDIRISSFPFSEFGDIKGQLTWIGSDALPPDENYRFFRFPATVELNNQSLILDGGKELPLQSGMEVSVNIKVKEDRTVLSLFTELFTNKIESLKQVR
ncbi:MAG: HlyD family efflux transporter periplasmic adaptor subunit [Oscillatoria sp. PMC 1051.18]|nr:HlyD family efflux transporter periplasmic adaptor subunit [Oscillatoria sp. PMC 1050.18]MEC5030830.1 HlyD family efflux transporter periplasmic adaptor subunit [Oscillatoria sp. PMC 1051.18]